MNLCWDTLNVLRFRFSVALFAGSPKSRAIARETFAHPFLPEIPS